MTLDPDLPGVRVPLDLKFKGNRTYLHGTDMLDTVLALCPALENFSVRIQKIATRQLAAMVIGGSESPRTEMTAIVRGRIGDRDIVVGLAETDDQVPPGRYAYDDAQVVEKAEIDVQSQTAGMPGRKDFSTIEQCVALQKALLVGCFADPAIHWYFTRLEVSRLPTEFDVLSLRLTQALGKNLVRSSVAIDGTELGNIFFSGVVE